MKICSKCGDSKDDLCFYAGKSWCIDCYKKKNDAYYAANKEAVIEKVKQHSEDNKEVVLARKKQYYEENKEILLEKQKEYYHSNFDTIRIGRAQYRIEHKEDRNKHQKQRYDSDPVFKLRALLSSSVFKRLKIGGSSKNGSSVSKHFSYSTQELRAHLEQQFEPWMNWNNHGKYNADTWNDNDSTTWTWQIDHIVPHSKLPYTSMEDDNFQKCWSLDNLRPFSAKQNLIDGNRRK